MQESMDHVLVGGNYLFTLGSTIKMIKITNRKLEKQILEILQNSQFSSVDEYLLSKATADLKHIRRGYFLKR